MADEKKNPSQDDLLKAVADVLDEALIEFGKLTKGEGIDAAEHVDDMKGQAKGVVGDGTAAKPAMAKEGDAPMPIKEEDKDKEDEDKDEDDEKLMQTYKSLVAKMEKRGLMQKTEPSVKKSETAPKEDNSKEFEGLKKSVDDRFDALAKAVKDVADTVKKIATTPAPRKGVAGYTPLRKNEEGAQAAPLRKSEIVGKLLDLRKSGNAGIDTSLINRVETGRVGPADMERLKNLGIFGASQD